MVSQKVLWTVIARNEAVARHSRSKPGAFVSKWKRSGTSIIAGRFLTPLGTGSAISWFQVVTPTEIASLRSQWQVKWLFTSISLLNAEKLKFWFWKRGEVKVCGRWWDCCLHWLRNLRRIWSRSCGGNLSHLSRSCRILRRSSGGSLFHWLNRWRKSSRSSGGSSFSRFILWRRTFCFSGGSASHSMRFLLSRSCSPGDRPL